MQIEETQRSSVHTMNHNNRILLAKWKMESSNEKNSSLHHKIHQQQ
jgi:hypothetical protein